MATILTARRLITSDTEVDYPVITIKDGHIASIEEGEPNHSEETLTPVFVDIHVHGACSHDFMTASIAEITEVEHFFASRGVGFYLPTTITTSLDTTLRALSRLADAMERMRQAHGKPQAAPLGIHLEGPFISHDKRGVHPAEWLLEPSVALFVRMQEAARGYIRLITLAPELPQAVELIEYATAQGVRISLGHSAATAGETIAAISAGASSATHLFNAMRPLDHREPGIIGAILDCKNVYAEVICDGIHSDPAMIRLWLKIKGPDRAILVTDGMSATGMPDGVYMLGDMEVKVEDGTCLWNGRLAGSALTMDRAIENVQRFTGTSLGVAVRLASSNPAHMLGMEHLLSLAPGQAANFNIFNGHGKRIGSIFEGTRL